MGCVVMCGGERRRFSGGSIRQRRYVPLNKQRSSPCLHGCRRCAMDAVYVLPSVTGHTAITLKGHLFMLQMIFGHYLVLYA
jgi:hypothetical protein